jgi:hypothetical protein
LGVAWQGADGNWHHLGEVGTDYLKSVTVTTADASASRVAFQVRYEGSLPGGVTAIEERFVLTPGRMEVTTRLPGYKGPVRRVVPLLADDGRTPTRFERSGETVTISQPGRPGTGTLAVTVLEANTVTVGEEKYPNHNGWARLAIGDHPAGAGDRGVTLVIAKR